MKFKILKTSKFWTEVDTIKDVNVASQILKSQKKLFKKKIK